MDDLVRWLGTQLDTDAEANASPYAEGAWHTRGCASIPDVFGQETSECDCGVPARVLREIDAKRMIVAAHERRPMPKGDSADCAHCWGAVWPCPTLRLIASVYNDRPGFREEWSP